MYQPPVEDHTQYGVTNPGFIPAEGGSQALFAPPPAGFLAPSAPQAYGNMPEDGMVAGGEGGFLPPPMPSHPPPQPAPGPTPCWNIPSITEDTAREALVLFASNNCCYSSGPAKHGIITNMEAFNTYRYRLETFTESRSTKLSEEPYHGQVVDAYTQTPPAPWAIAANVPTSFQDDTQVLTVPYTSSVKSCHVCMGMGKKPCSHCCGAGNKPCSSCNGSGFRAVGERCIFCSGRGRSNCHQCRGQGSRECEKCRGKQQLLACMKLTVTWTNNSEDYVVEQTGGLKLDNISKVSGKEMLRDSQPMVYPVMGFPDQAVVQASERLVRNHQGTFSQSGRILQQRQTIELIPITKVTYQWKQGSHIYFVFGNEFEVSADNYPDQCCCCTIM